MRNNGMDTSFRGLMVTQFLGAFNDNAFKIVMSLLALRLLPQGPAAASFVSLISLLFILPFVLFSPWAGWCADRFSKRSIIINAKAAELLIMVVGLFSLMSQSLAFMASVLFLMAAQSAFFSPAKYGILPEMLPEEELSRGNGYLQMWTFLAIICGTAAGGQMAVWFKEHMHYSSLVIIALSIAGLAVSFLVKPVPAAAPDKPFTLNALRDALAALREIVHRKTLFLSLCALAYFWFLGAVFQMNILIFGKQQMQLGDGQASLLLVAVSLGIGAGGVIAGRLSEGKVEFGLVPMGATGMSAFCILLGVMSGSFPAVLAILFLLGVSAGVYTVPLNAYFQKASPADKRGTYLAASGLISSVSILSGSLFVWLGARLALEPSQVFLLLGILSVAATVYILKTMPDALVRMINWLLMHTFYRIRVVGETNVPQQGGALLVANHVSFIDAVVTLAALKRPVRFMVFRHIYDLPLINQLCRIMRAIPVSFADGPKAIMASLDAAREAINAGEIVCIFPEGKLTLTGNMLPFNRGFEKIMKGTQAPIVPVYLDNVWGSIFSYERGKYFWKMPRAVPYEITVVIGDQMPTESRVHQVRTAVQELGAQACTLRGLRRKKLHIAFIEEVKRHPLRFCMADSTGVRLNYLQALAGVITFKRKLFPPERRPRQTNEMVGVLLPASCAASLANGAIYLAGKVPVNLNFTLSQEALDSCIRQAGMNTIVTSRAFLEKLGMTLRPEMVFLEEVKAGIGGRDRIGGLLTALLPAPLIKRFCVEGDMINVDDVATVIFSSGSTGEPKGVMLSHGNIFSNIEGFYQVFDIRPGDVVMGALPFFHSFGFTATMCFPVGVGIAAVYHSNPMDAAVIGKLVEKYKATILMGTPTFLGAYLRRCTAGQFASIRYAVAGAEKLKKQLSDAFHEKYGVVPFEGYGATELSPIVSVGYPGFADESRNEYQVGYKAGKVGHPIPGVAVKVVDPDTFEQKAYNEEGLLLVKGPNVMKGYLNDPRKTAEVIRDGWYITGDIAAIDEDGFVQITDRLSRFSKIGGEMVPHVKIEEKIMEVLGATDPIVAVTSVADEKKGERLAVLYTEDIDVDWLWEALGKKGLPNLWIPRKDGFYRVDAIPVLGTGKFDLKGIKALAAELAGQSESGGEV